MLLHFCGTSVYLSRVYESWCIFGKQYTVFFFLKKLKKLTKDLDSYKFAAKLNGAVGNYNAHKVVYPEFDWPKISQEFIESLGLEYNPYST